MKIENLIFDFGGVLYDIDYKKCSIELAKLSKDSEIFKNITLDDFIDVSADFETGLINSQQFRDLLRNKFLITAENQEIDSAWNSMLIGMNKDSINIINKLKDKFRISLLSNSNQIHYDCFSNESIELLSCFEKLFFSFQIGLRKPNTKIFEYVCQNMNFVPENTLFIDDSLVNIESAKLASLQTYHLSSGTTLSDLLHSIKKFTHIYNV